MYSAFDEVNTLEKYHVHVLILNITVFSQNIHVFAEYTTCGLQSNK